MRKFEMGDPAILKPLYLPVTVVGGFGDSYEIQHEVSPDVLVTAEGKTTYDGIPVDVIGDTARAVVISYTVPASRLIERQGVDDSDDVDQTGRDDEDPED
jgi:hypothetical protein